MTGRLTAGFAVALAAVAGVSTAWAAAPAAGPDAAQIALSTDDIAGSAISSQGTLKHGASVTDAYERTLVFRKPYGRSRFALAASDVFVTESPNLASDLFSAFAGAFRSKNGPKALQLVFTRLAAQTTNGKAKFVVKRVTTVPKHALAVGDEGYELGIVLHTDKGVADVVISMFRLENVFVTEFLFGSANAVSADDVLSLMRPVETHARDALGPLSSTVPVISGTPQQTQTLSATQGDWGGSPASYVDQWQRCDAAGTTCVDIPGATGTTYVVGPADTGSTLRIEVTATNRFGSSVAASLVTTAVV